MDLIFVLFPILSLFILFLSLYQFYSNKGIELPIRTAIINASIIFSLIILIFTEISSHLCIITSTVTRFFFFMLLLTSIFVFFIIRYKCRWRIKISNYYIFTRQDYLFFGILVIIFLIELIIALKSAPTNWDSMTYHLSRIMHWIINRNLNPYPTDEIRQIYMPPYAEILILNSILLVKSDILAALIQFFSMIGSLIVISALTNIFGGGKKEQWFAVIFIATLPMGILQSTSTQTDYVVSFYLITFVYLYIAYFKNNRLDFLILSAVSLGLALNTKQVAILLSIFVFFIYILYYIFLKVINFNSNSLLVIKKGMIIIMIFLLIILSINCGYFVRNNEAFGSIFGSSTLTKSTVNEDFSIKTIYINFFRNAGLHLSTNTFLDPLFMQILDFLIKSVKLDINDPNYTFQNTTFTISGFPINEDVVGNFLAVQIIFLSFITCIIYWRKVPKDMQLYIIAFIFSILAFCMTLKWQPWGSRLHLPYFVLSGPIVGYCMVKFIRKEIVITLLCAIIFFSTPFLFLNVSRPLISDNEVLSLADYIKPLGFEKLGKGLEYIAHKNIIPKKKSILFSPRLITYENGIWWNNNLTYTEINAYLKEKNFSTIGLDISYGEDDWEYIFWAIQNFEYGKNISLESIYISNPTKKFRIERYHPDIIISSNPTKKQSIFLDDSYYYLERNIGKFGIYNKSIITHLER